jgi:large subunit ribosomal protein L14
VVAIKSVRNKSRLGSKVKKGDICKAIVLRTKKNYVLQDGSTIFFASNCICLVTNQETSLSKRIVGPVLKECNNKRLLKFISISSGSV